MFSFLPRQADVLRSIWFLFIPCRFPTSTEYNCVIYAILPRQVVCICHFARNKGSAHRRSKSCCATGLEHPACWLCRLSTPYQRHWAPQHLQPAVTTLPNSFLAASRPTDQAQLAPVLRNLTQIILQPRALSCSIVRLFSHRADAILDGYKIRNSPTSRNLVEPRKNQGQH